MLTRNFLIFSRVLVMELCEGTLAEYISNKLIRIPKDSLIDQRNLIGQICIGLAYLHSEGIIHKDLKPNNVLLWRSSSPGSRLVLAKIADFGLAKQLKPGHSDFSASANAGTFDYMAPELLNAKNTERPVSFASDVYALGTLVSYISSNGKHPFEMNGIDAAKFEAKKIGIPPINVGEDSDTLLQSLINMMVNKEPKMRPVTSLIIHHPYFSNEDEESQMFFIKSLHSYFKKLDYSQRKEIFDKLDEGIEEWFNNLGSSTEEVEKKFQDFKKLLFEVLNFQIFHENFRAFYFLTFSFIRQPHYSRKKVKHKVI